MAPIIPRTLDADDMTELMRSLLWWLLIACISTRGLIAHRGSQVDCVLAQDSRVVDKQQPASSYATSDSSKLVSEKSFVSSTQLGISSGNCGWVGRNSIPLSHTQISAQKCDSKGLLQKHQLGCQQFFTDFSESRLVIHSVTPLVIPLVTRLIILPGDLQADHRCP